MAFSGATCDLYYTVPYASAWQHFGVHRQRVVKACRSPVIEARSSDTVRIDVDGHIIPHRRGLLIDINRRPLIPINIDGHRHHRPSTPSGHRRPSAIDAIDAHRPLTADAAPSTRLTQQRAIDSNRR